MKSERERKQERERLYSTTQLAERELRNTRKAMDSGPLKRSDVSNLREYILMLQEQLDAFEFEEES